MNKTGNQSLKVKETDGVVWLFKKHVFDMLEIDNPQQTADPGDVHLKANWMDSAAFFELIRKERPKYGAKLAFLIRKQGLPVILGKSQKAKRIIKNWDLETGRLCNLGFKINI